jgi:hypothetical protein
MALSKASFMLSPSFLFPHLKDYTKGRRTCQSNKKEKINRFLKVKRLKEIAGCGKIMLL